jgi:hypothetical protein
MTYAIKRYPNTTTSVEADDMMVIYDKSENEQRKITMSTLLSAIGDAYNLTPPASVYDAISIAESVTVSIV